MRTLLIRSSIAGCGGLKNGVPPELEEEKKLSLIDQDCLPQSGDLNVDQSRVDLYHGAIGVGMRASTVNAWIDKVIDQ